MSAPTPPPLRIGWTGAPWTRPQDLALLRPLAAFIAARPQQLRLVHVGHGEGRLSLAEALGLPAELVEAQPLQGHTDYLQQLTFQIGLAPLAPGSFNHYKSSIKLLEYSALGIAWLASDAEPYRKLCQQWNWPGRLCHKPSDWVEQLLPLLNDGARQQEGAQLKRLCHKHASYSSGVVCWQQLLSGTAANLARRSRE